MNRRSLLTLVVALGTVCLGIWLSPTIALSQDENNELKLLSSFETLVNLGFSPDDIAFWPEKSHLLIPAAGPPIDGIFEVTLDGQLVRSYSFRGIPDTTAGASLGWNLVRVTTGPRRGHFFMAEWNETKTIHVHEFDKEFNHIGYFTFEAVNPPGDSIAYNLFTGNLVIGEPGGPSYLSEVTLDGELVQRIQVPSSPWGVTFCPITGTYFAVSGSGLCEFTMSGVLVRSFDLSPFGVTGAVGVAYGRGLLFVADEGNSPPNSVGMVYIFKVPTE